MATARGGARGAAGATLETCLAEVRAGRPQPSYLLDGDAFLALRGARALAAALVPEDRRALNLVELDAAATPAEIAAELATGGLFGGEKVVLVQEPAFLASKEDADEAFRRAREQWAKEARRDAARRLLALAAKAGWTAADLAPAEGRPDHDAFARDLGLSEGAYDAGFVEGAARYAIERDLKVARGGDASALEALLAGGLPAGHVLVVAAGKVDGRLPIVKKLAAAGRRVTIALEKEGKPWEAQRVVLGPLLEALLAGTGKRVDRGGEARLAALVGEDARTLASEVAKLAAYAGDRKVIGAADVDAVVTRVASDPFFALGNAVEARDLPGALGVLDRALADGASPFMLLGSLAGTLRRLVVERERARRIAGEERIASYDAWQARVLPAIDDLGDRKPFGLWKKYEASMRFTRAGLLGGLAALAEADLAMKSGRDERIALERVLVGLLGTEHTEGSRP